MKAKRTKAGADGARKFQRLHVRLAPETLRRLRVACAMEDTAPGPYLERLIDQAARRWVVQDRPGTNRGDSGDTEKTGEGTP